MIYSTEISKDIKDALLRFQNASVGSLRRTQCFLTFCELCEKEHRNPVNTYFKLTKRWKH